MRVYKNVPLRKSRDGNYPSYQRNEKFTEEKSCGKYKFRFFNFYIFLCFEIDGWDGQVEKNELQQCNNVSFMIYLLREGAA